MVLYNTRVKRRCPKCGKRMTWLPERESDVWECDVCGRQISVPVKSKPYRYYLALLDGFASSISRTRAACRDRLVGDAGQAGADELAKRFRARPSRLMSLLYIMSPILIFAWLVTPKRFLSFWWSLIFVIPWLILNMARESRPETDLDRQKAARILSYNLGRQLGRLASEYQAESFTSVIESGRPLRLYFHKLRQLLESFDVSDIRLLKKSDLASLVRHLAPSASSPIGDDPDWDLVRDVVRLFSPTSYNAALPYLQHLASEILYPEPAPSFVQDAATDALREINTRLGNVGEPSLLRSAEEPKDETLLRAAGVAAEPTDQLLRPTDDK